MKTNLYWIFVLFSVIFFSCGHEESPVPDLWVDFQVNVNNAEFAPLQNPGGWVYVSGGYNGIFLYNFDNNSYYAYDRSCPDDIGHAPLVYDEKRHELCHADTTANCNSRFSVLLHGAVTHGSAKYPLKEYNVSAYGIKLRVTSE
ncbi:MAG: hypothetical protein J6T60_02155 [Bacteroidales bacterium]|nr:hypothetical protein [Bacteroidales bacterium]MBO7565885.1 hypothetical protein [Bacteroidales bacterium]